MRVNSIKTKFLIYILLISLLPLLFMSYIGYLNVEKFINQKEEEKITFFIKISEEKIINYFRDSKEDLTFLKNLLLEEFDSSKGVLDTRHKQEIANIFYSFFVSNKQYDQVGFIDKYGYEQIKINNLTNKSYIVPSEDLQFKGNSYYIKQAKKLKNGEIFVSNIDLNKELDENQQPLKPIVRFITPIYYELEFKGYLILCLNVKYLLDDINIIRIENDFSELTIFDEEGFYIFNPNKGKEWDKERDLVTGENFKKDYPELYQKIICSSSVNIEENKSHIIAWYPVNLKNLNNKKLYIFIQIDKAKYFLLLSGFRKLLFVQVIVMILIIFVTGFFVSKYLTDPILRLSKAVSCIGKGFFDIDVDIKTNDEIEILSKEVQNMAYELKDMYMNMEELVDEKTKELQKAHEELEKMAIKDSLTGLYNRHYFNQYIQNFAFEEAKKT